MDLTIPVSASIGNVNYSLVTTPIDIQCDLPYQLAPGVSISRPSSALRDRLTKHFFSAMGESAAQARGSFESLYVPVGNGGFRVEALPEAQWRYYVVETQDLNSSALHLHRASELTATPIDTISIAQSADGGTRTTSAGKLLWRFFGSLVQPLPVGQEDLEALRDAFATYMHFFHDPEGAIKYPEIPRAHDLLDSLSFIPRHSDFHVLGLFAIVEMLITHNPKLEDRGDSISHQIRSKMPLLFNRFPQPIEMTKWFGDSDSKKVWNALYAFRSAIAHGGEPNFNGGDLKLLKDRDVALDFLRVVVKRLLRHAYEEPQLLRDLCSV